jgi:hypothetical protein
MRHLFAPPLRSETNAKTSAVFVDELYSSGLNGLLQFRTRFI